MKSVNKRKSQGTIIMIHGMWCNGEHLRQLSEKFEARGYYCIRPTLPFHDGSKTVDAGSVDSVSMMDYVDALEEQIQQMQLDAPPILLGHSLGGLLAQMLAARLPTRALVLLSSVQPAQVFGVSLSGGFFMAPAFLRPFFWRKSQLPTIASFRRYVYNTLPTADQNALYPTFVPESGLATFESLLPFLDVRRTTRVDFAKITCPVFVAGAGKDRATPPRIARAIARRYGKSKYRLYPEMSHWMVTEPGIGNVANDVCDWLTAACGLSL